MLKKKQLKPETIGLARELFGYCNYTTSGVVSKNYQMVTRASCEECIP